jgi:hypothetical protein
VNDQLGQSVLKLTPHALGWDINRTGRKRKRPNDVPWSMMRRRADMGDEIVHKKVVKILILE